MSLNHRVQGQADVRAIRALLPLFAGHRRPVTLLGAMSAIAAARSC